MERYSEYKDSGVKWLGEIPSHWEVMSIKYTGIFENGLTYSPADTAKEGTLVLRSSNIQDFHLSFKDNVFVKKVSSKLLVRKGDIIICSRNGSASLVGKCALVESDIEASFGAFMMRYRPVINPKYAYYLFQGSIGYYKGLFSTTTINQLTKSVLNDIKVAIPNLEEQVVIGSYLDAATSKIDKAIAMQQKMIDLLNERKQIIIQNAVTKGLDKNVEMKDSNCKFLGKIPSTWEVCKTLYVLSMPITDGPHTTPQLYDDGIPFVSAEAVSCGNGYIDFSHIRGYISDSFYNECCKKYIPQRDDIYMIKSGATTGKVAIVNTDAKFTIWSPLAVFRVNKKKVLPYFLYYSLQSSYYQLQVQDKWSFGTQQNIGMRMLEKLILCYPSIEEQAKIVAFIKKNVDNFDSAITNCQRQIALLQERKQIIINEVVTGKIKVS